MLQVPQCSKGVLFGVLLVGMQCVFAPSPVRGQAQSRTPQVTATIIPEATSIQPGSPLRVAIRLVVAPGWHVYWSNPGESGLPTTLRWTGPAGFTAGPVQWPYPERKELGGLVVHAYEGEVVLLGEIHPTAKLSPDKEVEIAAHMRWGVCREVCIPQELRLSFRLPVKSGVPRTNRRWSRAAATASPRIPRSLPGWTLRARREARKVRLSIEVPQGEKLPSGPLTFFAENPALLPAAVSAVPEWVDSTFVLLLDIPSGRAAARLRGVLVASSAWDPEGQVRALRVDIPITTTSSMAREPITGSGTSWFTY